MAATEPRIDADPRPPAGLAMTYRVGGEERTGKVCHYERGTGSPTWQVRDDRPPHVWHTLMLNDRRIVEPPEYRRPT